jgi:uncharacterized protein
MTTPQIHTDAEQLLFGALDALKNGDGRPWSEMFHDDGVMEFPYALPGGPARLDGKAAIAAYIQPYPERIAIRKIDVLAVYHSAETMIVEFANDSMVLATGLQVRMKYVSVITLAEGKVLLYRDYWNPLVALQAMGGSVTPGGAGLS